MLNPKQLKKASRRVSDENFRFRCFLKQVDDEEVDAFVQAFAKRYVTSDICCACQNCCRHMDICFTQEDTERISAFLSIRPDSFQSQYLKKDADGDHILIKKPCPFLGENGCTVYEVRPACCAGFPYLQEEGFVFRLYQQLNAVSICPIVYELFKELKQVYANEFSEYLNSYGAIIG